LIYGVAENFGVRRTSVSWCESIRGQTAAAAARVGRLSAKAAANQYQAGALFANAPDTFSRIPPACCVFKLRQLAPTFCGWRRATRRRRRVPARRPLSRCRLAARSCGLSLDCQQSPVAAGRRRRRRPNTKTIDIDCQLHQRRQRRHFAGWLRAQIPIFELPSAPQFAYRTRSNILP
jgi:hypothetical protein